MTDEKITPFQRLREQVRHSGQQYRQNEDATKSIFDPDQGSVFAYDINQVENALDRFERAFN